MSSALAGVTLLAALAATEDMKEGARASIEKRKPTCRARYDISYKICRNWY